MQPPVLSVLFIQQLLSIQSTTANVLQSSDSNTSSFTKM